MENSASKIQVINNVQSCNVFDKVSALLVCEHVKDTTTAKPGRAGEKYLAINKMNPLLLEKLRNGVQYKVTIKVDGTCCSVREGRIWKRRDLKDARNVPPTWVRTGNEKDGHLIGAMPLEKGDTWHLDCYAKNPDKSLNMDRMMILDLNDNQDGLVYKEVDTTSLKGQSIEIMGPKWQKNPHGLTIHCAMRHGLIQANGFPNLMKYVNDTSLDLLQDIKNWFNTSDHGSFSEGVVVHLDDGTMFKLHRHHLDMKWDGSKTPLHQIKL